MSKVTYAAQAKADLRGIIVYTLEKWGENQAAQYLEDLEDCCDRLARDPGLGRKWKYKTRTFHRLEQGSHVIFFLRRRDGITISRILHKRMLPTRHTFSDE